MPNKKSTAPLIKGYLPVRLSLPSEDDETFFFVKEHFASTKSTLFVANVPSVPGILSRVLLQSLFGRFGKVERITVVENPRSTSDNETIPTTLWTSTTSIPSFLGPIYSQGRFAHVVFSSPKEMKRTLREFTNIMSSSKDSSVQLERLELQTLQDESKRLLQQEQDSTTTIESDDDDDEHVEPKKGILAIAKRYRASCRAVSRPALLEECNNVMEQYEDAEEQERRAIQANKEGPDEDGFITVSYSSTQIGSKRELEQQGHGRRRGGSKRSRKSNKKDPNEGYTDFYRFQTKESRKQGLQDLRKRFEQDLKKVKQLREERQYRPF